MAQQIRTIPVGLENFGPKNYRNKINLSNKMKVRKKFSPKIYWSKVVLVNEKWEKKNFGFWSKRFRQKKILSKIFVDFL